MNVDSARQQWFNGGPRFAISCSGSSAPIDLFPHSIQTILTSYFVTEGAGRWSRVSISGIVAALRVFLRYMASCGECHPRVGEELRGPRLYAQESLPSGPAWTDVHRLLADAGGDSPADVRDRAILMLLAVYGMRSGEVRSLRLDQIDWRERAVRVFRLKRRQPQVYPLLPSVAEAVARYIDSVRPKAHHPEIFLGLLAPHRPLSSGAMSALVRNRFMALDIQAQHRGPHALRHACAARLVAEGLSMKEIGDHLGHRTTERRGSTPRSTSPLFGRWPTSIWGTLA